MDAVSPSSLTKFASAARNRVVVITGGARGVGRAVALEFADAGAKVVIGDIDDTAGSAAVEEIRKRGGHAAFQRTDVTIWEHQLVLFQSAVDTYGRVDIVLPLTLLEHDTTGFDAPFDESADAPPEPDLSTLNVNQNGVIFTTKLALHHFARSSGPKHLVYLSASAPPGDFGLGPALAASKMGMLGLHRSFMSTVPSGTHIRTVAPSVATGFEDPRAATDLVVKTIFFAATDPSSSAQGSVYIVPPIVSSSEVTAITQLPSDVLSISNAGAYKPMMNRFWAIALIKNLLKAIVIRFYLIFGLY